MAIAGEAVWEVRSTATANNVNGGFFVTGASGVDYSQQDAAQYNLTGATSAGADAIILHASAAANMVGNGARVVSGTNATAGWYQITAADPGVSITLDRNWGTGAVADGVVNIGGALSLGHTSDSTAMNAPTAGNTVYIKQGTYTLGAAVSMAQSGGQNTPITIRGYNATRDDNPRTRATQPKLVGAFYTSGTHHIWRNIYVETPTGNTGIDGGNSIIYQCTFINKNTTANSSAIFCSGSASILSSEIICYRGYGISPNAGALLVSNCYIHHCNIGIDPRATSAGVTIINNIIEGCVTSAINFTAAHTGVSTIIGNSIYGAAGKLGVGINFASATAKHTNVMNNIFTGLASGIVCAGATKLLVIDNNTFQNNTADVSNCAKGALDIALAPGFASVAEYTGTTATTAGGVLTDSGAAFTNVVDGRDYIYIVSGTGVTAGVYGITSHTATTITPDIAPGNNATADKVYKIIYGHDFTPGTNLRGAGYPGNFPQGLSVSYMDIGAVQRKEKISSDPGVANVADGVAYTIDDVALEGTLAAGGGGGGNGLNGRRGLG